MTTKPINPTDTTQPATPRTPLKASSPPGPAFEMRFTSTPRGARLARRLAAVRLDAWGIPYGTDPHDAIVLIVAELTANAVSHGHVPGRDFHLRLHATPDGRTVRVEVTDTRTERHPRHPALPQSAGKLPGIVVSQDPRAGGLSAHDSVTIWISKARNGLVPNFVGSSLEDANRELERLGLEAEGDTAPGPMGVILRQSLRPGVASAPGLEIRLVVGDGSRK